MNATHLTSLTSKSDLIGAIASTLCFLHCLAAPLLFVAHAGSAVVREAHPWWWSIIDLLFLAISFFAVYWSSRTTSKIWIKYAFWLSWLFLSLVIVNEKLGLWQLSEEAIYPPTVVLILLHFYNRRYCHCENDNCCVHH